MDCPRNVPVVTKLGTVYLTMSCGKDYVYVEGIEIPVNGILIHFTLRLNNPGAGGYQLANHRDLYTSRTDNKEASEAARRKIISVVITTVNEFIKAHPELREQAEEHYKNKQITDLEEKIKEHEEKIAECRRQIAALRG